MKNFLSEAAFRFHHSLWKRDEICRKWHQMEESQWLTATEIATLQQRKLEALLKDAVAHVPYYREVCGGPIRLDQFPILDKTAIRKNSDRLHHADFTAMSPVQSSTSGSTGDSLYFYLSREMQDCSAAQLWRSFGWMGITPFAPRASLWGARFDNKPLQGWRGFFKRKLMPSFFFSSYDLSPEKFEALAQTLSAEGVQLLTSYPSPLMEFAEYVVCRRLVFPKLKAIICSSEQLFEYQRKFLEQTFKLKVFNRYGSREFGLIAHECDRHDGLHVAAERIFLEILDDDLKSCPPGVVGDLYITDLDNRAMPFIRYKIGDRAAWSTEQCACGRGLPLLERIDGRSFDLVRDAGGHVVSGTFWTLLTRYVSTDISAFQVLQKSLTEVELFLVVSTGQHLSAEKERQLQAKVAEKLPDLKLICRYVEHIPLTRSGKRRFVISELQKHDIEN